MVHHVVFGTDSKAGKAFDVVLLVAIVASVIIVMLDSVAAVRVRYAELLFALEWVFTILFTLEYGVRLWTVSHPLRYARSFFGLVDLFAVLPTYLALVFPGTQYLLVIRLLRLLRIFRILKLVSFISEAETLAKALRSSRRKITVFLLVVLVSVVILGSIMYFIEGEKHGYTSIPRSIYWAIVTLTTVGYGDISPQTPLGQVVASMVMIIGYGVIAVPTGIVSAELARAEAEARAERSSRSCRHCAAEVHREDAHFCRVCGEHLDL
ncbi:MAG: voltage-gated potassium channel [Rhodothermales bacterium]|jgi:voltage-gated potassium channel